LGFEKSQRSVTYDSLHYINILTYLLGYMLQMCHVFNTTILKGTTWNRTTGAALHENNEASAKVTTQYGWQ